MSSKWSRPTRYNGTKFRSKTEAIWAKIFDSLKVEWVYEPKLFEFDGLWYVPDFWLPKAKAYFEVKGVWNAKDKEKMAFLWEYSYPKGNVVAVGEFNWKKKHPMFGIVRPTPFEGKVVPLTIDYNMATIAQCRGCKSVWFLVVTGNTTCPSCGIRDLGDAHIKNMTTFSGGRKIKLPRGISFVKGIVK